MDFIPVLELVPHPGTGTPLPFYAYRAPWSFFGNIADIDQQHNVWRASASYVTGAHNLKVGYQAAYQNREAAPLLGGLGHPELPVLRRLPDFAHAAHLAAHAQQPHALRRVLRPGSVDEEPGDAAGRAALRARLELVPRGRERHHRPVALQRGAHPVPGHGRRKGLPRHHAAPGPGLGRLRQRQDLVQDQLQQVPAAGQQRERVHHRQQRRDVRADDGSQLGSTPTATTWPTAT